MWKINKHKLTHAVAHILPLSAPRQASLDTKPRQREDLA